MIITNIKHPHNIAIDLFSFHQNYNKNPNKKEILQQAQSFFVAGITYRVTLQVFNIQGFYFSKDDYYNLLRSEKIKHRKNMTVYFCKRKKRKVLPLMSSKKHYRR